MPGRPCKPPEPVDTAASALTTRPWKYPRELRERAVKMVLEIRDRDGKGHGEIARVAQQLGVHREALQRLGRYEQAAEHHRQAVAIFRELGNQGEQAWALTHIGTAHTSLGRPEEAIEYHRHALALFRQAHDREGETSVLNGLGEAAQAAGHPTDALAHHKTALTLALATGNHYQQARTHVCIGHAYDALSQPTRAREHFQHALSLYSKLGLPDAEQIRVQLAVR